ncbi:hypothetical protein LVJ94_42860 [Pendulispora rubella]|uniref:Uncharacterized protein n=1 Tax=Pendulispora rubella TaxID=2741070 RepID=A0ABZ2KYF6_9BACT
MTDGRAVAAGSNFTRGAPDNAGDAAGGGGGISASGRRGGAFSLRSPLAPPDLATGADPSLSFGAPSCAAG